jgi:hypothetical protein
MRNFFKFLLIALIYMFLSGTGCVKDSKQALFESDSSAVELRSYQSRVFDTTDKKKTLKTVIATMQDLGFVIGKADSDVGVVSGSKYANEHSALLTVTVREKNDTQMLVRANGQQHLEAVEDAKVYQDFFVALEKAMFLKAQNVD